MVAGHSAATMAEFYDIKTKNTTQKVIQSLNHKYGMLGNVEELESPSINKDREEDMNNYKKEAEDVRRIRIMKRQEDRKENVVSTSDWKKFLDAVIEIDSNWLASSKTPLKAFRKSTLKLILGSKKLQEAVEGMIIGETQKYKFFYYVEKCILKKEKKYNATNMEKDVFHQLLDWICKEAKKSIVENITDTTENVSEELKLLKKKCEENLVVLNEHGSIPTEELFKKLSPSFFSEGDLNTLLNEASKMSDTDWFVRVSTRTAFFNMERMQFTLKDV